MNCVYKFTSPSGKSYIGKTKNFNKRLKQHEKSINNGVKNKFYDACRKYGFENFTYEILENNISDDKINEMEIFYIKLYNTFGTNSNGYNLTSGGDGLSKNQRLLYNFKDKIFFIGYEKDICDEINYFSINRVSVKNNDTGLTYSVDSDEFKKNKNLTGVAKNTISVKNIITGKFERIKNEEMNENYVGNTTGLTPAWDLRYNKKVHISIEEFKSNDYFVRHLREWHAPKSINNINSQYAWSKALEINEMVKNGQTTYKIQKLYKSKVSNIIKKLLNGWNPLNDELWIRDFKK